MALYDVQQNGVAVGTIALKRDTNQADPKVEGLEISGRNYAYAEYQLGAWYSRRLIHGMPAPIVRYGRSFRIDAAYYHRLSDPSDRSVGGRISFSKTCF